MGQTLTNCPAGLGHVEERVPRDMGQMGQGHVGQGQAGRRCPGNFPGL